MVNFLDDQLANITGTMKNLGMWDNTLMILSSDNGGYVKAYSNADGDARCNSTTAPGDGDPSKDTGHGIACDNGEAGANNYPLRGGTQLRTRPYATPHSPILRLACSPYSSLAIPHRRHSSRAAAAHIAC
jgi:arylsulfatase A-like enzyme